MLSCRNYSLSDPLLWSLPSGAGSGVAGAGYSPGAGLPTSLYMFDYTALGGAVHTVVNLNMRYGPYMEMLVKCLEEEMPFSGLPRNSNCGLAAACFKVESNTLTTHWVSSVPH